MSKFTATHKRLTVAEVRRKYWNKKTKKGKRITIKYGQDLGTYGKNVSTLYFTPDGDLIEGRYSMKKLIRHIDWLSRSKSGPYKPEHANKGQPIFYYLSGKLEADWEGDCLHICSGPLNVLSTDCLDEVGCWVKK